VDKAAAHNARRIRLIADTDWYQLERWRKLAKAQLRREPLCARCLDAGRVTPATVADHVVAHGGDWNRFLLGELQSLCASCHSGGKQFEEVHGFLVGPSDGKMRELQ
jgi:5-methylcytosine-specific restriction protein A